MMPATTYNAYPVFTQPSYIKPKQPPSSPNQFQPYSSHPSSTLQANISPQTIKGLTNDSLEAAIDSAISPQQERLFSSYATVPSRSEIRAEPFNELAESYNNVFTSSGCDPAYYSCEGPCSAYLKRCAGSIQLESTGHLYASSFFPTARSGTSFIERITQGRIGSRRYKEGEKLQGVRLKTGNFQSPKIVRPRIKWVLKNGECNPFSGAEECKRPYGKNYINLGEAKNVKANKPEELLRVFRVSQFHRKIGSDIFLDNYRKRSPSPVSPTEKKVIVTKLANHYYATSIRGSAPRRYKSPVKIIDRMNTMELRRSSEQVMAGKRFSYFTMGIKSSNRRQESGLDAYGFQYRSEGNVINNQL